MISRTGKENFFASHYDWVVCGVGVLALAFGGYVLSQDAEASIDADETMPVRSGELPNKVTVDVPDMEGYETATRTVPASVLEKLTISDGRQSYFSSERRVMCMCGYVLPIGDDKNAKCPSCKKNLYYVNKQDETMQKESAWQKQYGVAIDGKDADNDGFTNKEEFEAGTDPTNAKAHGDYADYLRLELPIREKVVPFVLSEASPIRGEEWRCTFFNPDLETKYSKDRFVSLKTGEEIVFLKSKSAIGGDVDKVPTGYKLVKCGEKSIMETVAGVEKPIERKKPFATIVCMKDGREFELPLQGGITAKFNPKNKDKLKFEPIESEATIVYDHNGTKKFEVVKDAEFALYDTNYKVISFRREGGKCTGIILKDMNTGKQFSL